MGLSISGIPIDIKLKLRISFMLCYFGSKYVYMPHSNDKNVFIFLHLFIKFPIQKVKRCLKTWKICKVLVTTYIRFITSSHIHHKSCTNHKPQRETLEQNSLLPQDIEQNVKKTDKLKQPFHCIKTIFVPKYNLSLKNILIYTSIFYFPILWT